MDDGRRLPTGILVLLAVVLLGLGTGWWIRAAPDRPVASTQPAGPSAGSVLLLRLDDGRVLPYQKNWPGPIQWISETYFPCSNARRQPLNDAPAARFSPCAQPRPAG
jgi:hypothetical protein